MLLSWIGRMPKYERILTKKSLRSIEVLGVWCVEKMEVMRGEAFFCSRQC